MEIIALPAGDEENFIADKAADGTPVQDMTVKNLREDIINWKAETQKYKTKSEEKDSEIEKQYGQINSLCNENVTFREENGQAKIFSNQLKKEIDHLKIILFQFYFQIMKLPRKKYFKII